MANTRSRPSESFAEQLQSLVTTPEVMRLINDVIAGSGAEHAGLRGGTKRAFLGNMPIMLGGDLIVAIDGQQVEDQQDLSHIMNNHRAGDTVTVTIFRGQQKMDAKVTLGEAREQA